MIEHLLVRTDGNEHIGTGHVMRCLALAQAFQRTKTEVVFALAESTQALDKKIAAAGFEVTHLRAVPGSALDARETISLALNKGMQVIAADGYQFDSSFQEKVAKEQRLLLFDDYGHSRRYFADFIMNQSIGADPGLYRERPASSKLLLGTSYALLRNEFLRYGNVRRVALKATNVLVTLGGADPNNVTEKVLGGLMMLTGIEVTVVVGGNNPNLDRLRAACKGARIPIQLKVDVSNMPDLMAAADVAITGGGTTVWEAAFMGLPIVTLVLAENQRANCEELQRRGVSRNLGWHEDVSAASINNELGRILTDAAARGEMAAKGQALVDGRGALRAWLRLNEDRLTLRPARASDSRMVWEWANHSAVRAVSFSPDAILWDTHVAWFNQKLSDPESLFWIGTDEDQEAVGQVRFEIRGEEAIISVSLDPRQRGRQMGVLLIWVACRQLLHVTRVNLVHAYVKVGNQASSRAFEKAGFDRKPDTWIKQCAAQHFVFVRAASDL